MLYLKVVPNSIGFYKTYYFCYYSYYYIISVRIVVPCLELREWATNNVELKRFIDSNESNSRSKMHISDSKTYAENL